MTLNQLIEHLTDLKTQGHGTKQVWAVDDDAVPVLVEATCLDSEGEVSIGEIRAIEKLAASNVQVTM